jgi:hypothetical protein
MRNMFALLVLVLGAAAAAAEVLELTDSSLDEYLAKADSALVMFYYPTMFGNTAFFSEYEKAAAALQAAKPTLSIARVGCIRDDTGHSACNKFNIKAMPALQTFQHGQLMATYEWKSDSIVEFAKETLSLPTLPGSDYI